jgi:hypothetical protein
MNVTECGKCTTHSDSIKNRRVFWTLNFHHYGGHIFSQPLKLLGIIHTLAYSLSTSDCLLWLYTYAAELVMLHTLQDKRPTLTLLSSRFCVINICPSV